MLVDLIARLDDAVQLGDTTAITQRVKHELEAAIQARAVMLPDRFRVARAEGYARRLLHRNDRLGYTAVVEMGIFIGILAVGLLYAWRKGVLTWA